MIFQPIAPWWGLAILFTPFIILCIWQIIILRRTKPTLWMWIRRLVIVLLLIVISLRPSLPGASRSVGNALLDVYFVIDTTSSMTAEDYDGSKQRIDGVRQDVKDIAKELVGARFSIITFTNQALPQLPLTSDTSALSTTMDTIVTQEVFYGSGSSIDQPLTYLEKELLRIKTASPERGRLVFYLGDGEQTAEGEPKSFVPIKPLINGGAVLGYGTLVGGKMQERRYNENDPISYVKDYSGTGYPAPEAISKLDEENLTAIASQVEVPYLQRTKPGDIQQITNDIPIGEIIKGSRDNEAYDDLYWVAAIFLSLLLSYEMWRQYQYTKTLRKALVAGDTR